MITIDSRGCGEGKTTSAIYPKLKKHLACFQKVLIVVPSTKLQDQYDDFLTDPTQVVKINSYTEKMNEQDRLSVIAKIKMAMERPEVYIIIITQAAFKLLEVSPIRKSTWHLIIDEAFDPTRVIKYVRRKSNFDWGKCLTQPRTQTSAYIPVEIDEDYLDSWSYSDPIRNILDTEHWLSYVTADSYAGLIQDTAGYVEVYQELNPELMKDWASVHVAAAAFEITPMCDWFNLNKIPYTIKWPFEIRELPIILHLVKDFNWSKSRASKYPQIADNFRTYVSNTCEDLGLDKILTLRNNSDNGIIEGEKRLNHNPHGHNGFTSYRAISIESALNPTPGYKEFLKEHLGIGQQQTRLGEITEKEHITRAFSSYLFYQSIMRTAARLQGNTQEVHVFVLDYKSAHALTEYFTPQDVVEIPLAEIENINNKVNGRPRLSDQPLTGAERAKRHREKQKTVTKLPIAAIDTFVTNPPLTNEQKLARMLTSLKSGNFADYS